jgi:hypothetical protein
MDVIDGRLNLGRITEPEYKLLKKWVTDGYVILPNAVPEQLLAPAAEDLDRAFSGEIPQLRFDIHGVGRVVPWQASAQSSPSKALDIHWYSKAVRNLQFAPPIREFLHLIFERRALASQTLGFWRGSQQNAHQDSAYVSYSLPMQFAASWVALEDVREGAGELFYHPGSHRISEYLFHRRFKGISEAKRLGFSDTNTEGQVLDHITRITKQVTGLGMPEERFLPKRGDALIWAADLAHGGSKICKSQTRKSIVTHYCPSDCAPSFFENGRAANLLEHDGEWYTSSYYSPQPNVQ